VPPYKFVLFILNKDDISIIKVAVKFTSRVTFFSPFLIYFNKRDMETSCLSTKMKKNKKERNLVDINSLYLKARNVRRTSGWVPHTHFPQDSVSHVGQIIWVVRVGRRRKDTVNLMMRHTECSNKIRAERLSERKLT
jgi:hypothetical protein